MDNTSNYYIIKNILTALDLGLTGEGMRMFVQSSTGCTLEQYEATLEETFQGHKVFMDAHNTVTVVEGDRYPL